MEALGEIEIKIPILAGSASYFYLFDGSGEFLFSRSGDRSHGDFDWPQSLPAKASFPELIFGLPHGGEKLGKRSYADFAEFFGPFDWANDGVYQD